MRITTALPPPRSVPRDGTAWAVDLIGMALVVLFTGLTTVDLTFPPDLEFRADWQTYMRLGICAGCGLYGLAHLPRTRRCFGQFPFAWCALFGIWALATVPFALDRVYAAATVFALWCLMLFAPASLLRLGGRRVVLAVLVGLFAFVGWSWYAYYFMPEYGRYPFQLPGGEVIYRLGGNAQALGLQATYAVGLLLALGIERSVRWRALLLPLLAALVTVPFTQSRTAMILLPAVVGLAAVRQLKAVWLVAAGFVLVIAASLVLLAGSSGWLHVDDDLVAERVARSGRADEIYSFTGRTEIWQFAIDRIHESPLVGYGYGNSKQALADGAGQYGAFELHHAHNIVLNVILCTGVAGGLLLLAVLAAQAWTSFSRPAVLPDLVLLMVLVGGITEPVLFGPMPRALTIIWFVAVLWRQAGASLARVAEPAAEQVRHPVSSCGPGPAWSVATRSGGYW